MADSLTALAKRVALANGVSILALMNAEYNTFASMDPDQGAAKLAENKILTEDRTYA